MATTPSKMITLTNASVDVINAIRNSASIDYQNKVPIATPNADSIREIGTIIMDYPALQNEFLSALINRIGKVVLTSKMYKNPWAMFKKGILEYGESIEEIFVNIANPEQYSAEDAENTVFKRVLPDVKSAFHVLNYQEVYPVTIQDKDLRKAFMSWDGVTDLISRVVDSLYSAAEYDEFITMKYLLAKRILAGGLAPVVVGNYQSDAKLAVKAFKSVSNKLEFLSTNYNVAGVHNFSKKEDQYLIVNADFDAAMDVDVLAAAFNMDKAEFMGHVVLVDSFGSIEDDRLQALFGEDFTPLTEAEKTALDAVPAVLVDEDWFMIYDNLINFTEQYNAKGMYWNYFYHAWKTFSVSPFANAAVFLPGTPTVTSVTVSPDTVTASAGQTVQFAATVAGTNFVNKAVTWSITGATSDGTSIGESGVLTLASDETGTVPEGETAGVITVTATSVADGTKTDTATITIA